MTTSQPNHITEALKEARKRQGFSTASFSRKHGHKASKLAAWERGDRAASISNLITWADQLGYEVRLVAKDRPERTDVAMVYAAREAAQQMVDTCTHLLDGTGASGPKPSQNVLPR